MVGVKSFQNLRKFVTRTRAVCGTDIFELIFIRTRCYVYKEVLVFTVSYLHRSPSLPRQSTLIHVPVRTLVSLRTPL